MDGADRFEDLLTWRLMYELSLEVWKFTREPRVSRNFKYCDQIRDSSDSAHRNVAEGFGRYNPTEFVRFLDISRGSAEETRALLINSPRQALSYRRPTCRLRRTRGPRPSGTRKVSTLLAFAGRKTERRALATQAEP